TTNCIGKPDWSYGWAYFFCSEGYIVYMVDQPARGRSAWQAGLDGELRTIDAATAERNFTAPELYNLWPQATLHTQWPGTGPGRGRVGDPIFDQFYASQVQFLADSVETQSMVQHAG